MTGSLRVVRAETLQVKPEPFRYAAFAPPGWMGGTSRGEALRAPPRGRLVGEGTGSVTAFLLIGVAGLLLLGVSLVVGDILDGAFDALPGDAFSTAAIGGFVSAFGFAAAASDALGLPLAAALAVGGAAGLAFGWFALWLTRLLRGGDDDAVTVDDAVGFEGLVVTGVPADGFGTVRVVVRGHTLQLNARADRSIEPGARIHVTGVLSPTAVTVAPLWPELP